MGKKKKDKIELPLPSPELSQAMGRAILESILGNPPQIGHLEFEPPKVDYGIDLSFGPDQYRNPQMVLDPFGVRYAGLEPGVVSSGPVEVSDSFLDIRVSISVESGNMSSPNAKTVTLVPLKTVMRKVCGYEADQFLIYPDSRRRTIMSLLEYFCEEMDKMGKE